MDRVYMGRGSQKLLTCWIPFGDLPVNLGGLAVCEGSHRLDGGFKRLHETYGLLDTEAVGLRGTGWFTTDPFEISAMDPTSSRWKTANFRAGDVVIFGMATIHASTANLTSSLRLSADVRWQPRADVVDERYMKPEEKRVQAGAWAKDEPVPPSSSSSTAAAASGVVTTAAASEAMGVAPPTGVTMETLKMSWGF